MSSSCTVNRLLALGLVDAWFTYYQAIAYCFHGVWFIIGLWMEVVPSVASISLICLLFLAFCFLASHGSCGGTLGQRDYLGAKNNNKIHYRWFRLAVLDGDYSGCSYNFDCCHCCGDQSNVRDIALSVCAIHTQLRWYRFQGEYGDMLGVLFILVWNLECFKNSKNKFFLEIENRCIQPIVQGELFGHLAEPNRRINHNQEGNVECWWER